MKHLIFDSVGGASGNMILGVLAGLGADLENIECVLRQAMPDEDFEIRQKDHLSWGMTGKQLEVKIRKDSLEERGLHTIRHIIETAEMPERAKILAEKTFLRLAEAEAKIHGKSPEHIHFHEVGAVDSIVDILGSCMALVQLGIDRVSFGPLPEGTGTFQCRHGIYPLPAPATLELLQGCEIVKTEEPFEMVTPTGAALLTTWGSQEKISGRVLRSSAAFGTRELKGRPNVLRGTLLDACAADGMDSCVLLETNLDDISPEILGAACDTLRENGALDVWTVSAQMKKNRSGFVLSVLIREEDRMRMAELLFRVTGTFGIRVRRVERMILEREFITKHTVYGNVRIKQGKLNGEIITAKPELEECRTLAAANNIPLPEFIRQLR